jgi:hypothetical protein
MRADECIKDPHLGNMPQLGGSLRATNNQYRGLNKYQGLVAAAATGFIILLGAGGCGGQGDHGSDQARDLRRLVPTYLHSNPRRGVLAALVAQRIEPTVAGRNLLLTADLTSRNITRTIVPPWQHTQAATSTNRTVIAASTDKRIATWQSSTGRLLFQRQLPSTISRLTTAAHGQVIVSLDGAGSLASWELSDPTQPAERVLAKVPVRPTSIVALALAENDTRAVLITEDGTLYRYDLVTGAKLATMGWRQLINGAITTHRTGHPRITSASFSTNEFTGATTALVATAARGIFRIELANTPGKRVIPSGALTGTVSSLLEAEYSEPRYFVGTKAGVSMFSEDGESRGDYRGLSATGVALAREPLADGVTLLASNLDGTAPLTLNAPSTSSTSLPEAIGPEVASLAQGATGPVATATDGTILIAGSEPTGIGIPTSEDTSTAAFTADGDLLETRGFDANHIERLVKVKPGAIVKPDTTYREEPVLTSYYPSRSWWNPEEATHSGWYVNSVSNDRRFVVAGGQDPTRTAVVLVWNAKSGAPLHRLALTEGAPLGDGTRGELTPTIVSQVGLIPSKHLLVAYSLAQELLVFWSTDTWQQVASLPVGPIGDFDVSPDEESLVLVSLSDDLSQVHAGRSQSSIGFVDLSSLKEVRHFHLHGGELAGFNAKGTGLIVLASNGLILSQRTLTGTPMGKPIGPETGVLEGVAIDRRSSEAALAVRNGGVVLVDLASGAQTPLISSPAGAHPLGIEFSPTGNMLLTTNGIESDQGYSTQTRPSLWDLSERTLERRACALIGGEPSSETWHRWLPGVSRRSVCNSHPHEYHANPSLISDPQLAYEQGNTIYVATESGSHEPVGEVVEQTTPPLFAWSSTGALAWIAEDVLNVITPSAGLRRTPCPCSGVVFDGERPVALEANGSGVISFKRDLTRHNRRSINIDARYTATLLAITKAGLLVSGYPEEPQRNSDSQVYLVPPSGPVERIKSLPPGQVQPMTVTSPRRDLVALAFIESGGACYSPESLAVVNTETGHIAIPAMPQGLDAPIIRSLRWSTTGQLKAMIAPTCSSKTGGEANEPSGQEYELRAGKLIATEAHAYEREQNDVLTAEITGPVARATDTGALTVSHERVATEFRIPKVRTFSVRP